MIFPLKPPCINDFRPEIEISPRPPTRGWKVPYDGSVDETFSISPVDAAPQERMERGPLLGGGKGWNFKSY